MAPRARQAKGKARITAFEDLVNADVTGKDDSRARSSFRRRSAWAMKSLLRPSVAKAYGDNLLFDDLTFRLPRGGIVGVIGPNGAGKTTLFRLITNQEQPDGGTIKVGSTVELAYVDQSRDALNPEATRLGRDFGQTGRDRAGPRRQGQFACVLLVVWLQGQRSAEESGCAVRR